MVEFPISSFEISAVYGSNSANLAELKAFISEVNADPLKQLTQVKVSGCASPDGYRPNNVKLSELRANSLRTYIIKEYGVPEEIITQGENGISWNRLRELVAQSPYSWRNKALQILTLGSDTSTIDNNRRMNRLRKLDGGKAWRTISREIFPQLRSAFVVTATVTVTEPPEETPADTCNSYNSYKTYKSYNEADEPEVAPEEPVVPVAKEAPLRVALRTNMLYDAALVPNAAFELNFGSSWSIIASGMYAWWSNSGKSRFWHIAGGELDIRRYFPRNGQNPLSGHHLGIYGQAGKYDISTGHRGYQSDLSYGAGVEYGYSLPVARRLNIDFSIGVGYFGGKYKTYIPEDGHLVWQNTRNRQWFGPTRLAISLVWLIGNGNTNCRKGGRL